MSISTGLRFTNTANPFNVQNARNGIRDTIRRQIEDARLRNRERIVRDVINDLDGDEIGVAFLDVGQGNCAVVRLPSGETIVIDCNIKDANVNVVDFLKGCGVEQVDILVITHPHADHMSGLSDIASNFKVGEVWTTPFERDTAALPAESRQEYEKFIQTMNQMESKGVSIVYPTESKEPYMNIGKVEVGVLAPSKDAPTEGEHRIHDASLVMNIRNGKFSVLFGGDINEKVWDKISEEHDLRSTILNASHHGSDVGCNENVVQTISPDYTVISVGENMFGHPHKDAVETYNRCTNIDVLYTDEGSVGFRGRRDGTTRVVQ